MVYRIPKLSVPHISFIYGEHDWMDVNGGLDVQQKCDENANSYHSNNDNSVNAVKSPHVDVLVVKHAGHLLMLENWEEFNNSILLATCSNEYLTKHISSVSPQPLQLHHSQRMAHSEKEVGSTTHQQSSPSETTGASSSNPPTVATSVPSLES